MKKDNKGNLSKTSVKNSPQAKKGAGVNLVSFDKILEGKSLYVFLGGALLISLIVFWDFISFQNLYLYKDIGSDTVCYWWPHWAMLSEYIHKLGAPKWSFSQGMGQNVFAFGIGDPFSLFLCLLGKDSIPYAIVFMELIKIIGGGFFFYLFLREHNFSLLSCVTGGLLYSFCGYMILGSGWYLVSTEAFYAAFVLYSAERLLSRGTWYLLPIGFCLLAMLQPFYIYVYALFITAYTVTRFMLSNKTWSWKDLLIPLFKMGGLALFGVLLGSITFFSNALLLIQNPRVSGGASTFSRLSSTPMFDVSPLAANATIIYRMFGNDLMGAGSNFKGIGNYLEAPVMYVGLLSLLLAPQLFLSLDKRKRKIYLIVFGLCLVPMVFIYFRYLFWLFAGDFYRSYGFFIALMVLFFGIKALSNLDRNFVVHTKTLIATLLVLLLLLYYNYFSAKLNVVDTGLRNGVALFLLAYTGLIYLMGNAKYRKNAVYGLGILLFIELATFSNTTVNKRVVVPASELGQKKGYNDYTVDALAAVNAKDHSFFRIQKDYYTDAAMYVCLNDPQMQGYKGLTDYAEWNEFNYVRFLRELHVNNNADTSYAKWLFGLSDRLLLKTMANVKYTFSHLAASNYITKGYDSIGSYGNVKVFRNKFYLPLGYSYSRFISLDDFRKQGNTQKDEMLLNAFVAEDKDMQAYVGMKELKPGDSLPPLTFDSYKAYTSALKQDTLAISSYDENNIKGTIKMSDKKMLFFSIPYDQGWHAVVDGKEVPTYQVNIGFTGLLLDKGDHTVELFYKVPLFAAGACTSAIALVVFALAFIKFRKREF
jgi:hypothetical protein